jgi:hypothetical protein
LEVGVRVEVFGAHIFNLFGNLKDGIVAKIDLFLAKGEIRLYLKNGNGTVISFLSLYLFNLLIYSTEVWLHYDVKVTFDGHFQGDVRLLTI